MFCSLLLLIFLFDWIFFIFLFFGEKMGKKKVMVPANEVDLATAKYQYEEIEGLFIIWWYERIEFCCYGF